jgi:hypothetical protein
MRGHIGEFVKEVVADDQIGNIQKEGKKGDKNEVENCPVFGKQGNLEFC